MEVPIVTSKAFEPEEKENVEKGVGVLSGEGILENEKRLRSESMGDPIREPAPRARATVPPKVTSSLTETVKSPDTNALQGVVERNLEGVRKQSALGKAAEAAAKEGDPKIFAKTLHIESTLGHNREYIKTHPKDIDASLRSKRTQSSAEMATETVQNFLLLDEFKNMGVYGDNIEDLNRLHQDTATIAKSALDTDLSIQTGQTSDYYRRENGQEVYNPFSYDPRSNLQAGLKSSWITTERGKIGGTIIETQGNIPTKEQVDRLNYLGAEAEAFGPRKTGDWFQNYLGSTTHGIVSQGAIVEKVGLPAGSIYVGGKIVKVGTKLAAPVTGPYAPGVIAAGEGVDFLTTHTSKIIAAKQMFEMERNLAVSDMVLMKDSEGKPLDGDVIGLYANIYGGISAGLEYVSYGKLASLLPGKESVVKLFGKEGAKSTLAAMAKDPKIYARVLPIAQKYARRVAEGATTEGLTEALQELVMIWSEEGAMSQQESRSTTGATFERDSSKDQAQRVIDAGVMGAQVGSGIVALGVPLGMAGDFKSARRAKANREVWQRVSQSLENEMGDISKANPQKAGEMVAKVVFEDQGITHQIFDAEDLVEVLGDQTKSYAQKLGLSEEDIAKARETGQSVAIPIGKFTEVFAGTNYFQGLTERGRFSEDGMSPMEAEDFEKAQAYAKGPQSDPEQEAKNAQNKREWDELYQSFGLQMRQAGRSDAEADHAARLTADSYAASAERVGMSPKEYAEKRPMTIVGRRDPKESMTDRVNRYKKLPLGSLSAKYESNGDPGTISTGEGDSGGISYGAWQLASNLGTPEHFVEWLGKHNRQYSNMLKNAGLVNSDGFIQAWKDLATTDPKGFKAYQASYIKETHYDPGVKYLKDKGFDISKRGDVLKDVLWSNTVQHGGETGASSFTDAAALAGKNLNNMTDREIIQGVYDLKISNPEWTEKIPTQESVQAVHNRWRSEQKDALSGVEQERNQRGTLRIADQLPTQSGVNIKNLDEEHLNATNLVGDEIQKTLGFKATISSGYRDPNQNSGANGQDQSWHLHGKAVDLVFDRDLTDEEARKVEQVAKKYGFGEVLYHDAGSGLHLHMANLNKSFYQAITEDINLDDEINVVDLNGVADQLGPKDQKGMMDFVRELAKKDFAVPTADLSAIVEIPKDSYSQRHIIFNKANQLFPERSPVRNASIAGLADVIGGAVLVESGPAEPIQPTKEMSRNRQRAANRKSNIENYYRFFVPVRLGESDYTLVIQGEERKEHVYFSPSKIQLYEIHPSENKRTLSIPASSTSDSLQLRKGSSNSNIEPIGQNVKPSVKTIRDMLTGIKDRQGQAYVNEDGSGNFSSPDSRTLEQKRRGQTDFSEDGSALITLFKSADASTIIHELGHVFLEHLAMDILEEGATEKIKADFKAIKEWLEVDDKQIHQGKVTLTTEQHEKFAGGFETYLYEGKAPSIGLRKVFRDFGKWLVNVFKRYAPGVELTPDVRQVFGRLLATEEQIAESREQEEFFSQKKTQLYGLLDSTGDEKLRDRLAKLLKLEESALDEAKEKFGQKIFSDLNQERKALVESEREKYYQEVLKELKSEDLVYRTLEVVKVMPEENKILAGSFEGELADILISPKGRNSAEEFAAFASFDSVEEMAQAFAAARPIEEVAGEIADANVASLRAGLLGDKSQMEALGREAIYNDAKVEATAAEAEILGKQIQEQAQDPQEQMASDFFNSYRERSRVAKETAKKIIGGTVVGEINPGRYVTAARRYARKAMTAIAKEDMEQASKMKDMELLNAALAAEAWRTQKEAEKIVKKAEGLWKIKPSPSFNEDYLNPIRAMIEAFKLVPKKKNELLPPQVDISAVKEFFEKEGRNSGVDYNLPEWMREGTIEQKNYKEIPMDKLRDLHQMMKQIEYLGREVGKEEKSERKKNIDQKLNDLVDTIFANHERKEAKPFSSQEKDESKLESIIKGIHYEHAKVEAIADKLDGYTKSELGTAWRIIIQPIVDAEGKKFRMTEAYRKRFARLIEMHFGSKDGFQSTLAKTVEMNLEDGRKILLTHEEMLAMALNWGNEGNRDRLAKTMSIHGIGKKEIWNFLDEKMTAQNWRFAQDTWDMIDGYWPEIASLYKDWTGATPEKVLSTPIVTKHGVIRGGYYPIAYDPKSTRIAEAQSEKEAAAEILGPQTIRASTKNGHTEARTGFAGGRLLLDLGVIDRHVQNVIHDLSFGRAVGEVNQIIKNDRFKDAVKSTLGDAAYKQFTPWLVSVANPSPPITDWFEKIAKEVRMGTTVVNMAFKVTTALVQPLGATMVVPELGMVRTAAALGNFYKEFLTDNQSAMELVALVMEKSPFMSERAQTFDRDVNDTIQELKKSSILGPIHKYAFHMASLADLSITVPLWHEAYLQGIRKFEGNEADAIRYADKVIRQTQGSGNRMDMAGVQRGSEWKKLFTMHYSFFSVLYNAFGKNWNQYRHGKITFMEFSINLLWMWIIPAALEPLIKAGLGTALDALVGYDDGEDKEGELAQDIVTNVIKFPFGTVIFLRDIVNSVGPSGSRYGYKMSPVQSNFEAVRNISNALIDGKPEKALQPAWQLAATAGKLPGRQVQASVGEILNAATGKDDFSLRRFILGGQ